MQTAAPRSCAEFAWLLIAVAAACGGEPRRVAAQRETLLDTDACISLFGAPCCSGEGCDAGGAPAASGAGGDDSRHEDGASAGQGGAGDPGSTSGSEIAGATSPDSPTHEGGGVANGEGGQAAVDAASGRATSAGAPMTDSQNEARPEQAEWLLSGGSCRIGARPTRNVWLLTLVAFTQVMARRRGRRRSAPTRRRSFKLVDLLRSCCVLPTHLRATK